MSLVCGSSISQESVRKGAAGSPSLFIKLGLASSCHANRTATGLVILGERTSAQSFSRVTSAGTNWRSSPAIWNSSGEALFRVVSPEPAEENRMRICSPRFERIQIWARTRPHCCRRKLDGRRATQGAPLGRVCSRDECYQGR